MIHKEDEKTRYEILSFYSQSLANISFFLHNSSINSTQINVNCEGKILKLSLKNKKLLSKGPFFYSEQQKLQHRSNEIISSNLKYCQL